jgi:ATP-dependent Clp protease, protease subunit
MVAPAPGPREGVPDLLSHRILLLIGPLARDAATALAAQLMTLDADGEDEITFHIACQQGELAAALMLAETIELAVSPMVMIAKGVVGGVGLAPFAAAGRRVASEHASFWMREPSLAVEGVASQLTSEAEVALQQLGWFHDLLSAATGRSTEEIAADMHVGRTFDAPAARDYGLIDEVISGPAR